MQRRGPGTRRRGWTGFKTRRFGPASTAKVRLMRVSVAVEVSDPGRLRKAEAGRQRRRRGVGDLSAPRRERGRLSLDTAVTQGRSMLVCAGASGPATRGGSGPLKSSAFSGPSTSNLAGLARPRGLSSLELWGSLAHAALRGPARARARRVRGPTHPGPKRRMRRRRGPAPPLLWQVNLQINS